MIEAQFDRIETLKWLPWIGKNYGSARQTGNALLVVAESHYDWDEEGAREDLEDRRFTRWFIKENGIDKPNRIMPVLRNLERAIFNDYPSDTDIVHLWQTSAYYNFVQRILDSRDHRPVPDDYPIGWNNFFQLVEALKPNYCLFAGVGASDWVDCFNKAAKQYAFDIQEGIRRLPIVGDCYPRISSICSRDGHSTKLTFIKHPSSYFSSDAWAEFLEEQLPEYLSWLRKGCGKK